MTATHHDIRGCRKILAIASWVGALGCAWTPQAGWTAEPLVLQKIMKDMGRNMQLVTDGISREDYEAVEQAAVAIADHPQPPLGEKARIIGFIGSNMGRFKAYDGETHDNAMTLAKAAREKNGQGAIDAFHKLQGSCLACHTAFRKPFVDHFYGGSDKHSGSAAKP
ncbi:MAG: cytochrome c [Pseudomonadota bacterium]